MPGTHHFRQYRGTHIEGIKQTGWHSYTDQSPLVARCLGFASLPLATLTILVSLQSLGLVFAVQGDGQASGLKYLTS